MASDSPLFDSRQDNGARAESEAEVLAAAQKLAFVRPLAPYPGWNFGSDWDNPDLAFRIRRKIWEVFNERGLEIPLLFDWYEGLRLNLYLGNDLSRQLFVAGCSEPNEFAFLNSVLAPGMVFVDAGANDGLYSLFAARRVGPTGLVWAFEPSAREFARLEENLKLNMLENTRAFRAALADRNGEADLAVAGFEHEGQNTLGAFAHSGVALLRQERVSVHRLDDLVKEANLPKIDVMKIDVEGAEYRVLMGSQEVLNRFRPVLLFEALDAALQRQGASVDQLLQLIRGLRYEIFGFDAASGRPAPADFGAGNMIGVPAESALAQQLARVENELAARAPEVKIPGFGFQPERQSERSQPYISLVATARNDDQGGNSLARIQIFVQGWISQCRRHNLPSELILVEWNPTPDRPRLRDALEWPEDLGPCQVRFIEVPAEVHRGYQHAATLPLYPMIAKNVGIRRSRGRFILASDIGILFSDELMAYLAERGLESGRMYRIDRYDAMEEVPLQASLDGQLEYCRTHLLRINAREGTLLVDAEGRKAIAKYENPSPSRVRPEKPDTWWQNLQGLIDRIAGGDPNVTLTMPVPAAVKRAAAFYVRSGGLTGMLLRKKVSAPVEDADVAGKLHTNTCGDFTLAAREHWFNLRGYPEFDLYSMNIDSVFCYCANSSGVSEEILKDPLRIYHIEHAEGSAGTAEGQAELCAQLASEGVRSLPVSDVAAWAEQMRRIQCTMIFNHADWGLGGLDLAESTPPANTAPVVRAVSDQA